jgi:uncharacterized membrane protein (DUF2068 family)
LAVAITLRGLKSKTASQKSRDRWLLLIAVFKLVKGLLLLCTGIGLLALLHKDVASVAEHWVEALRMDPNNRYIHGLLTKLGLMSARQLEQISAGTFFYASLLLTEGSGLLLRKRWAEYLTVIATACFIPLEVYELIKRLSAAKIIVTSINVVIVWYLIARIRHERHKTNGHAETTV